MRLRSSRLIAGAVVCIALCLAACPENAVSADKSERLKAAEKVTKRKAEEKLKKCIDDPEKYLPSDAPDYLKGELYEKFCTCYAWNSARMGMAELLRKGAEGVKSIHLADKYAHRECYKQAVELGK